MRKKITAFILCLAISITLATFCGTVTASAQSYRLEKMLVLSRHGLRAPLASGSSFLTKITPHKWFEWTANPGSLSLRGGELETIMGQYFRKWLTNEGLISETYEPARDEMRFYSNSYQRTIATAKFFSAGMTPIANIEVERHFAINERDPIFFSNTGKADEEFRERVMSEIDAMGGIANFGIKLSDECSLVERVLDFKDSDYAKENSISTLPVNDMEFLLNDGSFQLKGSIRPLMSAADALLLQYYEQSSDLKASFGHRLERSDWEKIARLKDAGIKAFFDLPSLSERLARPLIKTMRDELALENRKFTFLCGHDINLATVLTTLGVCDYSLPNTHEKVTPIGAKLVIEKRIGEDGEKYAALKLIYQSTNQIRRRETLTLTNPPQIYRLHLKKIKENEDGLYHFEELMKLFEGADRNTR